MTEAFFTPPRLLLGVLLALAALVALAPLVHYGPYIYGYDSGFYRRYVTQAVVSFPNTPVPGVDHTVFIPRIVLDAARTILPSPDVALYGSYVLWYLLGIVSIWLFAQLYLPPRGALLAAALMAVSGVQFASYIFFFFKSAVALPFFLLALGCFEKKRYPWGAAAGIVVVLTQQTSSVLLLAIAAAGLLLRTLFERRLPLEGILSWSAVASAYLLLHPHVESKLANPPVGVFISQNQYLLWSIPIFLLAMWGAPACARAMRANPLLGAALVVGGGFAIFHLPFYTRIYPFLDIFLAIPAAFGCMRLIEYLPKRHIAREVAAAALLFAAAVPMLWAQYRATPPIDPDTIAALPSLAQLPQGASVITPPDLLPWVQGWSAAAVYSPGNLKEPHSSQQWAQYWSHQNIEAERYFLSSFPAPLYVFASPYYPAYIPSDSCRNGSNSRLYIVTCNTH